MRKSPGVGQVFDEDLYLMIANGYLILRDEPPGFC
jgi:hypothetical protein